MIKPGILSDEAIDKVVNDWMDKDWEVRSIQLDRGHWEYIAPIIAQAQNDYCYKEMLGQFEELIDRYMANGRYKAPWDDVMVNCISGDVEYIWGQLKQALQGLEEG